MSRVLVIPDIHLKPWILQRADKIMQEQGIVQAVIMGDIIDDWGNPTIQDYENTTNAVVDFIKRHPDTIVLMGNHEASYYGFIKCSGYRSVMTSVMEMYRTKVPLKIVHRINNVIFSHAGIALSYIKRAFGDFDVSLKNVQEIDKVLQKINKTEIISLQSDMDSPLWLRPSDNTPMWSNLFQVVGHTPVRMPYIMRNKVIMTDTFSTDQRFMPIGNRSFIIIDTKTGEFTNAK